MIFRRFRNTYCQDITKILQKSGLKAGDTFPNIFLKFSKIAEDFRGGNYDVSVMQGIM